MTPLPIALIGKDAAVGAAVVESLQPDFDVVHFMLSAEEAIDDLPALVRNERPARETVGSGRSYSTGIKAVVFGGAYDEASVEHILSKVDLRGLPQLRGDQSVPMPPIGPAYGQRMMERLQGKLELLRDLLATGQTDNIVIQY